MGRSAASARPSGAAPSLDKRARSKAVARWSSAPAPGTADGSANPPRPSQALSAWPLAALPCSGLFCWSGRKPPSRAKLPSRISLRVAARCPVGGKPAAKQALAAFAPTLAAITTLAPRRASTAIEAFLGLAFRARDLLARRLIDHLHGKPHLAAIIEAQELDVDLLALLHDLAYGFGPTVCELGDVDEPILGAEEVHKGAEFHDLDDLALVDLAHLRFGGDTADARQGCLDGFALGRGNLDGAVILDIDLGAALGHDLADHGPARTDDFADLVDGNLDRLNARGVLAELAARRTQGLRDRK